jgi:hypothetical protein
MRLTRIQYVPKITHRALRAGDGIVAVNAATCSAFGQMRIAS